MRKLAILVVVTAAALATSTSVAEAAAPTAPALPGVTVAAGLNNPRQLALDTYGNLYVAEAGTGKLHASDQTGSCGVGPEGPSCSGNTGSITRVKNPAGSARASRVATGLLSFAGPDGSAATGIDAVSVSSACEDIWGIMTHGAAGVALPKSVAKQNGQLVSINSKGKVRPRFDVSAYALAHPANGQVPDSDPYGLVRVSGRSYVADAAANVIFRVDGRKITTVAHFESRPNNPIDGTPTSIVHVGNYFYVGQLSSLAPGMAKITVFNNAWQPVTFYGGLSSVTSIAVARNGDIYATELFTGAPFNSPGALVKISHNGAVRTTTTLPTPGGVAVDNHGHVYVSVNSVLPGAGAVIRLAA
jgi:hypothetical protein